MSDVKNILAIVSDADAGKRVLATALQAAAH